MWLLLAAIGVVAGLAKLAAVEKSDDSVLRPALQSRRLAKIVGASRERKLTRTEAEDGLVLARRLGEGGLAEQFEKKISKLKKQSSSSAEKPGRLDRRSGK